MTTPCRVVVTGAREGAGRLAALLEAKGLVPILCPLIRTVGVPGPAVCAELFMDRRHERPGRGSPGGAAGGPSPAVAAVGPGTAEALRERGIEPRLIARESTQEGLVRELRPGWSPAIACSSPVLQARAT